MDVRIVIFFALIAFIYPYKTHKRDSKDELEAYIKTKKLEVNPRYRLKYHVSPPVGWINDPNGFSFFKGEYHLFYQFYPYDTVWGPMHWGHVSSPDLVNWKQLPTALLPEEEQCFSGSGIADGDNLILMYTAHIITDSEVGYNQSQYLAYSTDGIDFVKYENNPVLVATDGAEDFRDPKVWKHDERWYVVIGTKSKDDRGKVELFSSKDMKKWDYLSVIVESNGDLGYMLECPDFFELNGKFIILMSPQGMKRDGDRFVNLYQTGYIVGDFDYETFEFKPLTDFKEIDHGHDFYATQTTEVNETRYMVGWFGMWEEHHPEANDGWVNALTIVRELTLTQDNHIIQKPVEGLTKLRKDVVIEGIWAENQTVKFKNAVELIIEGNLESKIEILFEGINGGDKVWLKWDPVLRKVILDRNGNIRQTTWTPYKSHSWRVFLDTSSIELFCGEGEVTFSSRVYPLGEWRLTNLSSQALNTMGFNLQSSVAE